MRRDGNRPKVPTLRGSVGGKVKRVPARTGLGWVGLGWVGLGWVGLVKVKAYVPWCTPLSLE